MTEIRFPRLHPLEVASGDVIGPRESPTPEWPPRLPSPVDALRAAVLPALERSPCVVSFSGGRDSSAILALATAAAREEGLPVPIPVTLRFPDHPRSHEEEWQEAVVRHLGLDAWQRVDLRDEVGVLGDRAQDLLMRIGLYWPVNLQFLLPMVEAAKGGSVLTGNGGDETFQHYDTRSELLVDLLRRPSTRKIREHGPRMLPAPVFRFLNMRRGAYRPSWLRPGAQREIAQRWAELDPEGCTPFARAIERFLGGRYFEIVSAAPVVGAMHDVEVVSPFLDPKFLMALTETLPATGFASRSAGMTDLFGGLLPGEVLRRSTKAVFSEVFWDEQARLFAQDCEAESLDDEFVDGAKLVELWRRPMPPVKSLGLLQREWLRRRSAQP